MRAALLHLLAALACVLSFTSSSRAASCTINGNLRYQPDDLYYCDSNRLSTCTNGWKEIDLDTKTVGMPYMMVEVRTSQNGAPIQTFYTSSTGSFSTTVTLPSCSGTVYMTPMFWRRHETDSSKFRFRISDLGGANVSDPRAHPVTGATSTWNYTQARDSASDLTHFYAAYFTANSAVKEMVTWNSTISARFAGTNAANTLRIVMDDAFTGTSSTSSDGVIKVNWNRYKAGGTIRHELGHWVQMLAHDKQQQATCSSNNWPNSDNSGNHALNSCEWGFPATKEGLATFFGVRSITSADSSAWFCLKSSGADDICSDEIANKANFDSDSDGLTSSWVILDDTGANSVLACPVGGTSCPCGGANQPACNNSNFRQNIGFRIEANVSRFLWDIVDATNEPGQDDTDLSVGDIVTALVGQTCTGSADGSCNEPNPAACTSASRDKYNMYDLSEFLPGNESGERALNCLSGAVD